jgi:hypothetical protein
LEADRWDEGGLGICGIPFVTRVACAEFEVVSGEAKRVLLLSTSRDGIGAGRPEIEFAADIPVANGDNDAGIDAEPAFCGTIRLLLLSTS